MSFDDVPPEPFEQIACKAAIYRAHYFARLGFRVIPIPANSKAPSLKGWPDRATSDERAIEEMFRGLPANSNVGLAMGAGLIAVDVDAKPDADGRQWDHYGDLPITRVHGTPSGGEHWIYSCDPTGTFKTSAKELHPGIDIRATGGQIVAPGSTIDGVPYTVEVDCEPAPAPEWLLDLIRKPKAVERVERQAAPSADICDDERKCLRGALFAINPDVHRDTWLACLMALHHRFSGSDEGLELADEWSSKGNKYAGSEDVEARWRSFKNNPDRPQQTEGTLYKLAQAHGWNGKSWRAEQANANPGAGLANYEAMPSEPTRGDPMPLASAAPFPERFRRLALPADQFANLPVKPWIVRGLLERRQATVFTAPGGVGKSQGCLMIAAAVASGDGRPFGLDVLDQGLVLVLNAEDGPEDQMRRAMAIELVHGLPMSSLPIFNYDPGDAPHFVLVERDDRGRLVLTKDYWNLVAYAKAVRPALIVIDSLVKSHRANENDNTEMAFVMAALNRLARLCNCAVLVPHHTSKPPRGSNSGQEGDQHASRGASAIINDVRINATLQTMDEATAERLKISDRRCYVRLDDAKANHFKRRAEPIWYQMVDTPLPNGESAPALKLAIFESAERMTGIERKVFDAIKSDARRGSYKVGSSPGYAVTRLAVDLIATKDEIKSALMNLKFQGLISEAKVVINAKPRQCWVATADPPTDDPAN